jgi:membrane protein YdbS with pleckstrin-like domain
MPKTEFEINRDAVERYFRAQQSLGLLGLTIVYGLGIVLALVHYYKKHKFSRWICQQQADNLRYRLEGSTIRVDSGVYFLFRKSIPLERITDVVLVQGPLLRYFDIWAIRIQTAGSAQCEATLYGVRDPEKVREIILAQRKSVYGEKTEDA